MKHIVESIEVEDYNTPDCQACECSTEPVYVLDEDEHKSLALKNVGYCIGCDTLITEIYRGGTVGQVEIRSPLQ